MEHYSPPQLPLRFFRWFCQRELKDYIEGDLMELYDERVRKLGKRKADIRFIFDVLLLFRPGIIKPAQGYNHINNYSMFKNYFKISFRGLMRYPLNSFINLFGLAAAIGFCVFAFSFAQWTYSRDQFHEHKDKVFLTTFFANRDGSLQQYGSTPRPLAELLKQDFPQIKKVCRVEDRNVIVKYEDNVFHERIRYTDPEFLEMFTFPLKWGLSTSLSDANSIILSEKMATKYFGEENPIGQSISLKFDKDLSKEFKVTGVAAAFPVSRSMDFGFLVNYENLYIYEPGYDVSDWSKFVNATFIQLDNVQDLQSVDQGIEKYKYIQNEAVKEEWAIVSFAFQPLATLHERTDNIRDDIFREGTSSNYSSIMFLTVVCVLMLVLACFNYINIAIVSATKRLKEIGVRKSIGATRRILIVQFLTENIVTTLFALVMGLALGMAVVIPWFEGLWGFSMGFRLSDPNLWIYLPGILLITGIASGIYPAFYISRFQAVSIFKGNVKFGTKNPLTKVFLGAQLVLACLFITSAVMFTKNSDYLAHRDWGYSPRDVLYVAVQDQSAFEQLHAVMIQEPDVVSTSGSNHHLGKNYTTTVLHFPDREYETDVFAVDANYFATMGLELTAGRTFHDHEGSDRQAVVVNEHFVENLAMENAVGKVFKIDSIQYEVVGVAKDFHNYSFSRPLKPTLFKVAAKEDYRYLSMKVRKVTEHKTYQTLQAKWAELFPETPFNGGYQEDVWGFYFEEIKIHGHVWRVFASVAVLLASLGLYGLVSLNVSGRTKEFSIRKVLGATLKHIATNISRQYLALFVVAIVVGAPLSYFMIKVVLDFAYAYHIPVTFWSVSLASLILVAVLLLTVSTQVWRVSKANPVEGLKAE
jgi:putative ABC transport system permease protein